MNLLQIFSAICIGAHIFLHRRHAHVPNSEHDDENKSSRTCNRIQRYEWKDTLPVKVRVYIGTFFVSSDNSTDWCVYQCEF